MKLRGYISSREFMGERVPQHIQNIVLRNYCKNKDYTFFLSASEYTMNDCYLILNKTISEINELDGIIAYSVFQMPEEYFLRDKILKKILEMKKNFYYAVEDLSLINYEDIQKIHELWEIKKTLNYTLKHFEF